MTAVAISLTARDTAVRHAAVRNVPVRTPRTKRKGAGRAFGGPRPVGPTLQPRRSVALAGAVGGAEVRSCSQIAPAAMPMVERVQLTERGLALVLGGFAGLALLTVIVLVNAFLSFSNAPLV